MLLDRGGNPVETWREGYPYRERMRGDYERTKRRLQIDLLKLEKGRELVGEADPRIVGRALTG